MVHAALFFVDEEGRKTDRQRTCDCPTVGSFKDNRASCTQARSRQSAIIRAPKQPISPSAEPAPAIVCSIDKEADILGATHLIHHGLDALFKLATFYFLSDFESSQQYTRRGVQLWRSGVQSPADSALRWSPVSSIKCNSLLHLNRGLISP
jgi:hypothetical protein